MLVDCNVHDLARHRFTVVVNVVEQLKDIAEMSNPEVTIFWAYKYVVISNMQWKFLWRGKGGNE